MRRTAAVNDRTSSRTSRRPLRVGLTAHRWNYVDNLYRPMGDRVRVIPWTPEESMSIEATRARLPGLDVFHLHWPEYFFGFSLPRNRAAIDAFKHAKVPIIWTAHDATPHNYELGYQSEIYALWAEAASGFIHHSEWGREEFGRRYRLNPAASHRVIPHPAWGKRVKAREGEDRAVGERHFGLPPAKLRLGIHGGPRPAKDVQLAMDAVAASSRQDIQLFVVCLADERVPDDPRIVAIPAAHLNGAAFRLLLQAVDVFLLPFQEGGSILTTGLVADALTVGKPMLISDHPYLVEATGEAGICYGRSREDLTACLERLDDATLATARAATHRVRKGLRWKSAAIETVRFLREVHAASGRSGA